MFSASAVLHNRGHDLFLQRGKKYGEHLCVPMTVTLCRMLVLVRMKLSPASGEPQSSCKQLSQDKSVNTKADSQGSSGRAVSIY